MANSVKRKLQTTTEYSSWQYSINQIPRIGLRTANKKLGLSSSYAPRATHVNPSNLDALAKMREKTIRALLREQKISISVNAYRLFSVLNGGGIGLKFFSKQSLQTT